MTDARAKFGRLLGGPSAGAILDANKGLGPGFDFLRIALSLTIILIHSSWLADPKSGQLDGVLHPLTSSVLPMFFGLSGFLVTGSAIRLRNVRTFLTFRVLRIMPALVVEVTLSAVILGSLLTVVTPTAYYSDPKFLTYFGNIVGWIHFELPGVFLSNPYPDVVNGNLWTLHPEFVCYGIMALLIVSRLVYDKRLMTIAWAVATIAGIVLNIGWGKWELVGHYGGTILVYCFLTGVVAFHHRHAVPINGLLAAICAVAAYAMMMIPHTTIFVQAPLIYVMLWAGMQKIEPIALLKRGDYSYGIYLYGFPIQQTLVELFPGITWWMLFPASALLTTGVAALSWHIVEKPALTLKRFVLPVRKVATVTSPA